MKNKQGKSIIIGKDFYRPYIERCEFKFLIFDYTEEMVGEAPPITPRQKLDDLIRLAELCVDLLRQNEEFYAEVD